jgi:hypothetical protein
MQPSLMPFTPQDFTVAEAETERLLPALAGRMHPADPGRSINGMFSFTPDAGSIVGESAKVRGVWVCEAVWVTHGGGMGRQVAEWMTNGEPGYDLAEADANRFYPFQTTPPYVLVSGKQQYRQVYDILHPRQQMEPSGSAHASTSGTARRDSSPVQGKRPSGSRPTPGSCLRCSVGAPGRLGRAPGPRSKAPSTRPVRTRRCSI